MNLFARFFLILLLFAMAPLTATGVWVLRFNRDAAETSRRVHEQIAQLAVDLLESAIGDLNRALGFIHDLERGAPEEAVEFKVVQRAMAAHSGFLELAVWRADGSPGPRLGDASLLASADALARDGLVARARADGRAALGEAELLAGHPSLPIAHPLADGRVVYARYSLRQLWARLDRQRIGKRGRVLVLDDLSRPLPGLAQDFPVSRWTGPGRLEEASGWLDAVSAGRDVFVGAFAASPSLRWRVLTLQPRAEAIALNDRFVAEAVTVLVFIGLAVALGAYWLTGRLTRPLRELVRGAERVAQSEFQHAVPPLGWGELDGLGRSFNTMMETLRSYQERQVERLLDEKAKVDALVNTVPDGILLSSLEGEVVYMNAAARGLLSVPEAAKGRGRRLSETLREPILRRMVQDLMKGLQAAVEAELELKDPGGNPRGIFLCRAVTVAAERRTVGILLMLRDVTAQRQMDRMKEEFFHSIVHDLRGPLGTIDGFVQIMGMGALDPPRLKKFTSHIRSSCERLRQLVSDILDTAKIESGTLKLNLEPVPASEILERMQALYQIQGESRGIEVRFERSPAVGALVCDRSYIERVVMNLFGNSLKFTPKGGRVSLGIREAGPSEVEFCVSDTGPGIPEDKLGVIFEKFKQLDGPAARAGYGLGLSICKKIVELHGGRIWAESKLGQGSRFLFRLPVAPVSSSVGR